MSSLLFALGRWVVRRRGRVLLAWVAALAVIGVFGLSISKGLDDSISIPGLEASEALSQLSLNFKEAAGTSAQYLILAPEGHTVTEPGYEAALEPAIALLEDTYNVTYVISPYSADVTGTISEDGRAALLTAQVATANAVVADATWEGVYAAQELIRAALPEGAEVTLGGGLFSYTLPRITLVEVFGVIAAFIVLIINLGSLLAAGLPIVIALAGVGVTTAVIFGLTSIMSVLSTTPILSLMLGMAVGIDYSLFIISRHRQLLRAGVPVEDAAGRALATSGSAVVFAGLTVITALVGLAVAGIPFLTIMGMAAAAGVALAVLAALTLLPALLGFAGDRLKPKPKRGEEEAATVGEEKVAESKFFSTWVNVVTRRPLITIVAVIVTLALSAIPFLDLRLALPDAGWRPVGDEARTTYDRISEHFGEGANSTLVVTCVIVTSTDPLTLMENLGAEIAALEGVASVPLATPNQTAEVGIVQVIPTTGPTDAATEDLVRRIRDLREHFQDEYGVDIKVTGLTAVMIDVSDRLAEALLPFACIVVGLSLVLLTLVFRSLWVPVKAALGYLLSCGAAFGAVVTVFQFGALADLLNVARVAPIIAFMPIIIMGVLFGLAMDYELFLVSRMREAHAQGLPAREAVKVGFLGSARVVTSAAIIMFLVFAAFVPESDQTVKPMALGLAVGVFVDAFVVRMTLVPAVMTLLGERAWWLPRWLDARLPEVDIEGTGLQRELELADWPEPGTTAVVVAEDVPLIQGRDVRWTCRIEPGDLQAVETPDPRLATAALLIATGRLRAEGGRLKSLGFVLPGRAGAVRVRSGYVDVSQAADPAAAVARALAEGPELLAVDGADPADERLAAEIAARDPRITVLLAARQVPAEARSSVLEEVAP